MDRLKSGVGAELQQRIASQLGARAGPIADPRFDYCVRTTRLDAGLEVVPWEELTGAQQRRIVKCQSFKLAYGDETSAMPSQLERM